MFNADDLINHLRDALETLARNLDEAAQKLSMSPQEAFGDEFWDKILKISTLAFMPIAIFLVSVFAVFEFYSLYTKHNGDVNVELVTMTSIKCVVPFLIVARVYDLMNLCYWFFNDIISKFSGLQSNAADNSEMLNAMYEQVKEMSFGQRLSFGFETLVIHIAILVMGVIITIIVYGRIFEIMLFWLVSPIPLSTLPHSEHNQIAKNFIKLFLALILQGVLLMLCFVIYSQLAQDIIVNSPTGSLWQMLSYSALLIMIMVKTGSMSKRMLGTF